MNQESVEQSWLLMDSLNNQVAGQFLWENGAHLVFDPDSILIGNMVYILSMPVDSVFDFYGNKLMDTLFVKNFMTLDPDTLSAISGMITDQNETAKGYFYLHAHSNPDLDYYIRVDDNEEYHFENIMPGLYIIDIFRDADRDSEYSYGQVYPYHPAERYYVYPDTISIRSGWPNEGNDIRFPSPGLPDRTEK
jgi:hypothetical protein